MNDGYEAYWISPTGKSYGLNGRHINDIFSNPERYGLEKSYIQSAYKRHNEPFGVEGKAREELFVELMKKGWIRVRYDKKGKWMLQVWDNRKSILDNIWNWSVDVIGKYKNTHRYVDVIINFIKTKFMFKRSLEDIAHYVMTEQYSGKTLTEEYSTMLTEKSLTRIKHFVDKHDIAIITAFRSSNTYKENTTLNKELLSVLLKFKYGVTKIDGSYIEDYASENEKEVKEHSFFVVNINDDPNFYDNLFSLGKRYNQDSVLIKLKTQEDAYLIGTNDSDFPGYKEKFKIGMAKLGFGGQFFSRVKGRPFIFTENVVDWNTKEMILFEQHNNSSKYIIDKISEKVIQRLKHGGKNE